MMIARQRSPAVVRARAPLRIGLAGGGTDVSPYCETHGGAVMNVTIARYAYATLELTDDGKIVFEALDRNERSIHDAAPHLDPNGVLDLHKGVYNRIVRDFLDGRPLSFRLRTSADAVAGSGLGSSSALVVAMVRAFVEALSLPLGDYELAHLAYLIERVDLRLNGGKQDQYAAAFGGFNFMEFYADDRVIVNPLRIKDWVACELEASMILYFTGTSRMSAEIIDEQSANVRAGKQTSIEAMHALKNEGLAMKHHLLLGDFGGLVRTVQAGWEAKKRMARSISNEAIDRVEAVAYKAGAYAGKMSGAGGGGFMFFLAPPEARQRVIEALDELGGIASGCHFTSQGATAWTVPTATAPRNAMSDPRRF
jgi:D-glycero-alpha-D-manno-heptose-7-phosphate kinase